MTFAFIENNSVTKYPVGPLEIKRRFPGTSFPSPLEGTDLSGYGVATIENVAQPAIDSETQKLEEGTPELSNGVWRQVWNVIDLTADELQGVSDRKAAGIRFERDQKLTACDWTILPDSPLSDDAKTEWQTYRQALRDMPADSGFPHSVTWPTKPS